MSFFNRILATFVAAALSLALVGCNTMSGIGQDISVGGKALSKSADQTQTDLSDSSSSANSDTPTSVNS